MNEKIIVSLTSYGERLNNLPIVLDTIYAQTLPSDLVVLNLAYEEVLPKEVEDYLRIHNAEINRVVDTKVYKKIIPTLKKYPNDCVICIDDDWLYPPQMIEDFMNIHKKYPNNPISGNKFIYKGMQCHCGCASLVKKEYFGQYLNLFSDAIFFNCKSDDMFYTYCATKNGYPYLRTNGLYFTNMQPLNSNESYSEHNPNCTLKTLEYLNTRYGSLNNIITQYLYLNHVNDSILEIIDAIEENYKHDIYVYRQVYNSLSYRIGHLILFPFLWLKRLLKK